MLDISEAANTYIENIVECFSEIVEVLSKAVADIVEIVAPIFADIMKVWASAVQSIDEIKRAMHLSEYGRTARVRKKNRKRVAKWIERRCVY